MMSKTMEELAEKFAAEKILTMQKEIALRMMEKDVPVEQIARCLDLSVNVVQEWSTM